MNPLRAKHTFILSILFDSATPAVLRGRVRHVSSDDEQAFASADELSRLLTVAIQTPSAPDNSGQYQFKDSIT